jgi:hypothetical protein
MSPVSRRIAPSLKLTLTSLKKGLKVVASFRRFCLPTTDEALWLSRLRLVTDYKKTGGAFEQDMQRENSWFAALTGKGRKDLANVLRVLNASVPSYGKLTVNEDRSPADQE